MSGRLQELKPAELTVEQRELYDSLLANEIPHFERIGVEVITADGALLGPFNPLFLSPALSAAELGLMRADGANTTLTARVHEIVILTTGAVCDADYELYAHRIVGQHVGLSDEVIDAIIAGERRPEFESTQEAVAHDFTWQLAHDHRVDDATYERAADELGEAALMDMVMLIGLYLSVCAIVNAFDVPVPAGAHASAAPEVTR